MKRLVAILTAMTLAILSFAVIAFAEGEDPLGQWYLSTAIMDGQEVDASVMATMGISMSIEFKEDGTVVMSQVNPYVEEASDDMEGTWSIEGNDGTISFNDNDTHFVISDGLLTVSNGEETMTFSKEMVEAGSTSMAPAVTDANLEDFNGVWDATTYEALGIPLPIAMMGTEFSFDIQDGNVKFKEITEDGTFEKEFTSELAEDGTLFIDFGGEEVLDAVAPGASGIRMTLHEDGKLSGVIPEVEESMEMLAGMSEEGANEDSEAADDGDSAGSSGGSSMEMYIVFEKEE